MKTASLILLLWSTIPCFASELKIQQVEWQRDEFSKKLSVKLNLSWKNAWHNAKNYDAAWLFFKFNPYPYGENDNYTHAKIALSGHKLIQNHIPGSPMPHFEVPTDQVGLFVYPKSTYRGDLNWSILIDLENPSTNIDSRNIGAYGIEMVMIPQGNLPWVTPIPPPQNPISLCTNPAKMDSSKGFFKLRTKIKSST
jgi:hypothetical protein